MGTGAGEASLMPSSSSICVKSNFRGTMAGIGLKFSENILKESDISQPDVSTDNSDELCLLA